MTRLLKFSSIGQFSQICKKIRDSANYHNEIPGIYKAYGTVKIHGTNAAICNASGETWTQTRETVITDDISHYGFNEIVKNNKDLFNSMFEKIRVVENLNSDVPIAIFGELAGKTVQDTVGVSLLDKFFTIFDVYIYVGEERSKWTINDLREHFNPMLQSPVNGVHREVYAITQFPVTEIDIDFSNPKSVQNQLAEYTIQVENYCPVAKALVPLSVLENETPLIGEGMVWSLVTPREGKLLFKVKGVKHSVTNVKTLASVDPELVEGVTKFVDYALTENRLNQGIDKLKEMGHDPYSKESIGKFVKWVIGDCIREELDTLTASNISPNDVASSLGYKAKRFILDFQSGKK